MSSREVASSASGALGVEQSVVIVGALRLGKRVSWPECDNGEKAKVQSGVGEVLEINKLGGHTVLTVLQH